jgi:hypothetical protein
MAIVGGLGYDGLWLDRFGFGPEIAVVEPSLGQPSLTSADGRFVVYDLRPLESVLDDLVNRSEIRSLVDAALDNDASDSLASLTATFGRGFRGERPLGAAHIRGHPRRHDSICAIRPTVLVLCSRGARGSECRKRSVAIDRRRTSRREPVQPDD